MALDIRDQEYFNRVLDFADRTHQRDQLNAKLQLLDEYAEHGERGKTRCRLSPDFAPQSFHFGMERRGAGGEYAPWFNGGLIYHGPHDNGGDGSFPTLAVTMSPTQGWSIHT
jgi:hypothetical protein